MLITSEQFWCPKCGRQPQEAGEMVVGDKIGGWESLTCRRCGSNGDLVCNGDVESCCRLWSDGWCSFHGNYIGLDPHPYGLDASKARQKREAEDLARHLRHR